MVVLISLLLGGNITVLTLLLLMPTLREKYIARVVNIFSSLSLLIVLSLTLIWSFSAEVFFFHPLLKLFGSGHYLFKIDLLINYVTIPFLLTGSILFFAVTRLSRSYLHREDGFRRYFISVTLFSFGYNLLVLSGNFETLLIGWEILGLSSFLLIGFYRERYLPVKNAIKVFSLYRLGDLSLILTMWILHHLIKHNLSFDITHEPDFPRLYDASHISATFSISLLLLLAASIKSAQFPFTYWLPRAMEGPTTSSAIFYGSLSVHMGVFLLLRTSTLWEPIPLAKLYIALTGLLTMILSWLSTRVQTNIKGQIAYASTTQIGIMFFEIAMGWYVLALMHFTGNALLRTFQLLTAPGMVTYRMREQIYTSEKLLKKSKSSFISKHLRIRIYSLSLQEWNMEWMIENLTWKPLKKTGSLLNHGNSGYQILLTTLLSLGLWYLGKTNSEFFVESNRWLPEVLSFIGLIFVIKAYAKKENAMLAWVYILLNCFLVTLSVTLNESVSFIELIVYFSGVFIGGFGGLIILYLMHRAGKPILLDRYRGYAHDSKTFSAFFLLFSLLLSGFPISPTFIGEDMLFAHIQLNQWGLATFASLSFVLTGISIMRIYSHLFYGKKRKESMLHSL